MKKTPNFKVGDKVFAKVKGYPPWPAHIIAKNGKKYNVKFYGTGETGVIKLEDIAYFTRNKDKFQKPLKRKDYVDAFEQIEKAIKEDGGDGDNSTETDESITSETDISNTSLNSTKGVKKLGKRKRSASDKSLSDTPSPPKKKTSESLDEGESENASIELPAVMPMKKPSKVKGTPPEAKESKEFKFVPINDGMGNDSETGEAESVAKPNEKEQAEALDFKVEIVSEKVLKNNITYASYVKEKESLYKDRPVERREDFINQVLPVKLSSGIMGGLKLHTEWPLNWKFQTEYARAIYDESVATRVLEEKKKIESGDTSITNNHELFIRNIEMSADDVTESLYLRDMAAKKARLDRLKIEADLMALDSKIKNCLGLDKADPKQAIGYLAAICDIQFDDLMLKKHPHLVEMVRRLRKYVGNTKEWNLTEESLNAFTEQAERVRETAEAVYAKFKTVVKVPDDAPSFWDGFNDLVVDFRNDCKDMTEAEIYVLCAEPSSRRAFFDHLDEIESEKENSSGVANSEPEPEPLVNGGVEVPRVKK